jgi:hypothetical protein
VNFTSLTNLPLLFGVNATEQMRLTSTGLGIGTSSPGGLLQVSTRFRVRSDGVILWGSNVDAPSNTGYLTWDTDVAAIGFNGTGALRFDTSNLERMRLDSSGNLGLGVTPSAWASTHKAYQLKGGGGLYNNGADGYLNLANNFYYDGADWRRVTAAPVSMYLQSSGGHLWGYTGTGSANSVCGFPSAQMALDSSGNLLVGLTSATGVAKLQVSGAIRTTGFTVATLPAGTVGMRTYVTDALAPSFGVAVAGSGAVTIPVFYDGANWIVA